MAELLNVNRAACHRLWDFGRLQVEYLFTEEVTMTAYQQRVLDEKRDLDEKARKLSEFIGLSQTFESIDPEEQELLKEQCEVMHEYSEILAKRIAIWSRI